MPRTLQPPGERVEIPFDGTVIAGILPPPCRAYPAPNRRRDPWPRLGARRSSVPTEDLFLSRGLRDLVASTGQDRARRSTTLPIRGDWEVPGAAILDAVASDARHRPGHGSGFGGQPKWLLRRRGSPSGDERVRATVALVRPCIASATSGISCQNSTQAAFTVRSQVGHRGARRGCGPEPADDGREVRRADHALRC